MALNLRLGGWHESFGIMWSVTVGFLYIPNSNLEGCLWIEMSKKLSLLLFSFSIVKWRLLVILLNCSNTASILVDSLLYTIKMSSTYRKYPRILLLVRISMRSVCSIYPRILSICRRHFNRIQ